MKRYIKDDAVFLITGCSSGFGKGMAEYIAKLGFKIVATARDVKTLDYLGNNENILCLELDITNLDSIQKAIKSAVSKFGKIDVLINNAGINYLTTINNLEQDKMRLLFETNIIGIVNMTKETLPYIPDNNNSAIVNLSSMSGLDTGWDVILYGMSKHAVNGLTQAIKSTKHCQIRTMSVNPGKFASNMRKNSLENPNVNKEEAIKRYLAQEFQGDINVAAKDIINFVVYRKKLPMYMILGHRSIRRFKRLIRIMQKDYKTCKRLSINKGGTKKYIIRMWKRVLRPFVKG